MTIILFLFFLSLLIIAHEFGHFLAAKKLGAIVEEFSLGFPPRIFSRRIKETVYSIGVILFGGFVKLKGEDNPNDLAGFLYLSPKRKLLIVSAGVLFNILLAYFLFVFSLSLGYPVESQKIFVSGFVKRNSWVAQKFQIGDEILAVRFKGQEYKFKNLQELSQFLKANQGQEIEYIISRQGQILTQKVKIPAGIYLANFTLKKEKFPYNFLLAFQKTLENFKKIIFGFFQMIKNLWRQEKINLEIIGPIGIYNLFDYFKNFGWGYLFYFLGVLSLNLAFINFLPIPALDGGRVLFILFEIFGKKLDYRQQEIVHRWGFIFLLLLLLVVSLKDISQLLKP